MAGVLGPTAVLARTIVCRTPRPFPLRTGGTAIGLADLAGAIGPATYHQ